MAGKKILNTDENNISQLERIREYYAAFQLYNGTNVYITLKLDPNWIVFGTDDQNIVSVKDNGDSSKVYVCGVEGITIKAVVDHIERIVEHNVNSQKKYQLCLEKANEFKQLLSKLTLEELKTLTFNYKGKPKKAVATAVKEETETETIQEENNNSETGIVNQ